MIVCTSTMPQSCPLAIHCYFVILFIRICFCYVLRSSLCFVASLIGTYIYISRPLLEVCALGLLTHSWSNYVCLLRSLTVSGVCMLLPLTELGYLRMSLSYTSSVNGVCMYLYVDAVCLILHYIRVAYSLFVVGAYGLVIGNLYRYFLLHYLRITCAFIVLQA